MKKQCVWSPRREIVMRKFVKVKYTLWTGAAWWTMVLTPWRIGECRGLKRRKSMVIFTRKGCLIWRCLSSSCRSSARCGFRCCSSGGPLWATTPRKTPSGRSRRWRKCRRTASAAGSSVSAERSAPTGRDTGRMFDQLHKHSPLCRWHPILSIKTTYKQHLPLH